MCEKASQPFKKLIDLPDLNERIEFRKSVSKDRKKMEKDIKPTECILCGGSRKGFCNSHTIPQLSLKNITDSGMLISSSYLVGNDLQDDKIGLKASGTIQIICNNCDSIYFKEYENEKNLKSYPSDKMLAQIALKNFLLEIVRRREEKHQHDNFYTNDNIKKVLRLRIKEFSKKALDDAFKEIKDIHNSYDYDIEDFQNEILIHKEVIENNMSGAYQVVFHEILPYRTPIAFQGSLTLIKDMYGYPINNVHNYTKENRIQKLHLGIFPLKDMAIVLAFYHKKDRKYKSLKNQFNSSSRLEKLEFINYLIFAYTENYYFSPSIKEKIRTDKNLVLLSQELFGKPNLGQDIVGNFQNYKQVKPNEIPNFLLKEWALV